jgi:hypothetical protein
VFAISAARSVCRRSECTVEVRGLGGKWCGNAERRACTSAAKLAQSAADLAETIDSVEEMSKD